MTLGISSELENKAINTIRMLSVDAVQKANSGHPGMPMGAATMAYVLWTEFLKHNPANPDWVDRDRFVLSAGHGSAMLYSLLNLTGYDLPMEQLKQFRQLGSVTPGHPERELTTGVEVTTGPLGQGVANAVGMAIAEANLGTRYNRNEHRVVDHFTYVMCSDGDLMEGVAMEATTMAGHFGLGKLIMLFDSNDITLAGSANLIVSDQMTQRFEAIGWHVQEIDGMDPGAIRGAISTAKAVDDQPSLIIGRTVIGFGSPKKEATFGVHGSPLGPDEVTATKENLGWPLEPTFLVPEDTGTLFRAALDQGEAAEKEWKANFSKYAKAFPDEATEIAAMWEGKLSPAWDAELPAWKVGEKISTRKASEAVIAAFVDTVPGFIGGSADLDPSTNTGMKGAGDFGCSELEPPVEEVQGLLGGGWNYGGRNIHWGIREHAMGSAVNGLAAHGGLIPFSATFLVFSDYMRPPIRLAALSRLHSIFVFTHDSIAVGEDGPTHQPVEQLMSLRLIPELRVIRPADGNETAAAWKSAIEGQGPLVLVFSRQDLPILDLSEARGSAGQGAYLLADSRGKADITLIATGSEVFPAWEARKQLAEQGVGARVVSMPSWEIFQAQSKSYQKEVLGSETVPRLTIEAGTTIGWERYTGVNGGSIGIDSFGASGPGGQVMASFGFTPEHVTERALALLGK